MDQTQTSVAFAWNPEEIKQEHIQFESVRPFTILVPGGTVAEMELVQRQFNLVAMDSLKSAQLGCLKDKPEWVEKTHEEDF